ncbi:MAG: LptE family protein [Candidatus Krumholzibacteria bacterium]|nr:LptE family protein [Candidatus Krumholzibacteria bacterium]
MQRRCSIIAATVFLVLAPACGIYSTKGRTAGDIKKIAVPNLSNETAQPDIEIDITSNLRDGLIKDNTLKVVPEDEADAVLEGTVIDYRNVPFTFNADLQAEQYRLFVSLSVSLFNPKDNSYIWKDRRIEAHSDYYLETATERNYDKALEEVYKDIVEGILNATTQEW